MTNISEKKLTSIISEIYGPINFAERTRPRTIQNLPLQRILKLP